MGVLESARPLPPGLLDSLRAAVGEGGVSQREEDRLANARDMWPRLQLQAARGRFPAAPDVVVWPSDAEQVAAVVRAARQHGVPLVPLGGGSGVCGGAAALRGGVSLDLKRLDRVEQLDAERGWVRAQAGIIGEVLERRMAARGFTLGHFPSSIYCSTLGGWLAARGAGQMSTRYGKIEDMVLGLQVVTPAGEILELDGWQPGFDWTQVLVGSEGTLGVITAARMRLWPAPAVRVMRGLNMPHLQAGAAAIEAIMRAGLQPAVVRLYDPLDTYLATRHDKRDATRHDKRATVEPAEAEAEVDPGSDSLLRRLGDRLPGGARPLLRAAARRGRRLAMMEASLLNRLGALLPEKARLILCFEGPEAERPLLEAQGTEALRMALRYGAEDLGPDPGWHWLEHRYDVSYKQSPVFTDGAFADTMEVAAGWDRVWGLYTAVRDAISERAAVMAHMSHAYAEGCSIYLTFVGSGSDYPSTLALYDEVWQRAARAAIDAGGTITHHHGVGAAKGGFMHREHGAVLEALRSVKRAVDPSATLNPGKLGLEDVAGVAPPLGSPGAVEPDVAPPSFDARNGTVSVPATLTLREVERFARGEEHSLGLFPPALAARPIGEVAALPCFSRASRWDLVVSVQGTLARRSGRDTVATRPVPRSAAGPDTVRLLLTAGPETFRPTRLVLRARRLHGPPRVLAWRCVDPDAALAAARRLSLLAPAPLGVVIAGAEFALSWSAPEAVIDSVAAAAARLVEAASPGAELLGGNAANALLEREGARHVLTPARTWPDDLAAGSPWPSPLR